MKLGDHRLMGTFLTEPLRKKSFILPTDLAKRWISSLTAAAAAAAEWHVKCVVSLPTDVCVVKKLLSNCTTIRGKESEVELERVAL